MAQHGGLALPTAPTVAILLAACGQVSMGPLPPSATCTSVPITNVQLQSASADGENVDSTCASVAGGLAWKMRPTGATCAGPLDCTPVCCACANATFHALSTWCNNGTCAAPETVCCMVLGTTLRACGG